MLPTNAEIAGLHRSHRPGVAALQGALLRFVAWLDRAGYSGYDQYDLWATRYGIWSRRQYYRRGLLAVPFVAPLAAADWLVPGVRRWLCPRRRYATADAHYLMGFLSLHRALGRASDLHAAVRLASALQQTSIAGFSGPCWGYPFDWESIDGHCPRHTPLVTVTPYVFDAFLELAQVTGDEAYLAYARSIADFVARDLHDTPARRGRASPYTPLDRSQVINASAYRAACLARAAAVWGVPEYRALAQENAHFVVDQQLPDGSWPYAAGGQAFVDHIHTCFVLKGLYRAYQVLNEEELLQAVCRGYAYYRGNLFYPGGLPRPFARGGTRQFRVAELYDYAEALNLALVLRPHLDTQPLADRIAAELVDRWQTPAGHFVTRVSAGGVRNCVPYHRWGQAQAFRALALYFEGRMRA